MTSMSLCGTPLLNHAEIASLYPNVGSCHFRQYPMIPHASFVMLLRLSACPPFTAPCLAYTASGIGTL
jgi:hypothetical protein